MSSTFWKANTASPMCVHRSLHLQVVFVAGDRWDSRHVSASLKAAFHVQFELPRHETSGHLQYRRCSEQEALEEACPNASMLHEGSVRVRYIVCTFVERQ